MTDFVKCGHTAERCKVCKKKCKDQGVVQMGWDN